VVAATLTSRQEHETDPTGTDVVETVYGVRFDLAYEHDGRRFLVREETPRPLKKPEAETLAARYPPGSQRPCYVAPSDPGAGTSFLGEEARAQLICAVALLVMAPLSYLLIGTLGRGD
jgi:hypothetical protein